MKIYCPFCGRLIKIVKENDWPGYMMKHDFDCVMFADGENGIVYEKRAELEKALTTRPAEQYLREQLDAALAKIHQLTEGNPEK
jgi:hypothetical protein